MRDADEEGPARGGPGRPAPSPEAPGAPGSGDDAGRPEPERGEAGRGPDRPGTCELCGGPVLERHCKIVCLTCGYLRDCSDP